MVHPTKGGPLNQVTPAPAGFFLAPPPRGIVYDPNSVKNLGKTKIGYGARVTNADFRTAEIWFYMSLVDGAWKIEKIEDPEGILFPRR